MDQRILSLIPFRLSRTRRALSRAISLSSQGSYSFVPEAVSAEAVLSAMPVVSIPDERESGNNAVESGSITVESAVFSESPPLGTVSCGKPVCTSLT